MAMTFRGAVETNRRDGGVSDGRGDHLVGYFAAPGRVCSGLRTATESVGRFFQFRTHFVPTKYPCLMKPKE